MLHNLHTKSRIGKCFFCGIKKKFSWKNHIGNEIEWCWNLPNKKNWRTWAKHTRSVDQVELVFGAFYFIFFDILDYYYLVEWKNNYKTIDKYTRSVDQVEVVFCALLYVVGVGEEVSGLLAGHELPVVGAERDGTVSMPDQVEQAVGRSGKSRMWGAN